MHLPARRHIAERKMVHKADVRGTVEELVATVNDHDTYTGGHSIRVAEIATLLGRMMGLSQTELDLVRRAGFVHDVGKIGIPDRILHKPGPLDEGEFALVKLHPTLGASILSRIAGMDAVIPVVLHHHERWDGRGYPAGLSGVEIPLAARIIFVADAFDAITSERPYGATMTAEETLAEIQEQAGRQFDALVVDALVESHTRGLVSHNGSAPSRSRRSLTT